ncbi:MAG: family 2A encapsulin nanocompartment shell protein [Pseudomonadota bacterium]
MADDVAPQTLGDQAARQLANATKTVAQYSVITPRWLVHLLQWLPVEAGIYRVNKVKNPADVKTACTVRENGQLPDSFVNYEERPREYFLNAVSTKLNIHTRVSDLYSSPHDQIKEQLRLTIETIKEHQESELINNPDYGLLASVADSQRILPLTGAPTPDDLDELLTKVWKEPAFFLTHPLAIAAFGRECTRRGVPPPTVSLFGAQFLTWRGIPLIPSDKIPVADGKSKILLIRVGEKRQGVVGLFQPGLPGEQNPGLSVRLMGIDQHAIASYLISLYCSLAVLTDDAIALLDDVEVNKFHDYPDTYK